jgi:hypothetical protein
MSGLADGHRSRDSFSAFRMDVIYPSVSSMGWAQLYSEIAHLT